MAKWLRTSLCNSTFWLRGRCTPLSGSQVVSLSPPVNAIYPPPPLLLRFWRQPVGWRVILHVTNRRLPSGCSRAEWACPDGQAHSAREYLGGRSSLRQEYIVNSVHRGRQRNHLWSRQRVQRPLSQKVVTGRSHIAVAEGCPEPRHELGWFHQPQIKSPRDQWVKSHYT